MEMKMVNGCQSRLAAFLALASFAVPVSATADDPNNPWYMRAGMGLMLLHDNEVEANGANIDYDPGFNLNTAVGYRFTEVFRAEGEFAANVSEVDDSDAEFNELRFLVNGIAEVPDLELLDTPVAPFVGLGLGLAASKIDGAEREASFTLQVELGIEAKVTENLWVGPA
jgi:opacity protein-like surface antigen